jgi:signal transduction histidine kinase
MKVLRIVQLGWLAAILTVLLALVPLGLAYRVFETESLQKQEQLFDATSRVVQEHLQLLTVRHLSFINTLRFQVHSRWNPSTPLESILPPGALSNVPYVTGVAIAELDSGRAQIRSTAGRNPPLHKGDNALENPAIHELTAGRLLGTVSGTTMYSMTLSDNTLLVLAPMPQQGTRAGATIIAWIDLHGMCEDAIQSTTQSGDVIVTPVTRAASSADPTQKQINFQETGANWKAFIAKGPLFFQHYSLAKPWLVFISGIGSALLLGVLVLLGSRAIHLRAQLRAERQAGLLRSRFVNHVSHEFRTPLSVILSSADLLEIHGANIDPTRTASAIHEIQTSTRLLSQMVDEVLLLQRLDSWKQNPETACADIAGCCELALRTVRTAFPRNGPLSLIDHAGPLDIHTDTTLLRTVLVNLLSNAVKYSPAESPVELALGLEAGMLVLQVRDRGMGIPEDALPHLGEAFFRARNVGEIQGTGLGLSIVHRSVEVLGGIFEIENRSGGGTIATMRLPLQS